MSIIEQEATEAGVWKERWTDWDAQSLNNMWDVIKPTFESKYCKTKRKKELTWSTAYANMSKANVFKNSRNKEHMNVE